jgi:ElaB/YqjD/DUF883 family membrane-anchored ribosome-binding protein
MNTMSSAQLERETDECRAKVEQTMGELKAKLTPGQLVDELLAQTKDGGGRFVSNLGDQITANPMPVTLIGAGLAWFLFAKNKASQNGHTMPERKWNEGSRAWDGPGYQPRSTGPGIADRVSDSAKAMASSVGDSAQSMAAGASDAARSMASGVMDTAQSVGTSVNDTAKSIATSVTDTAQSIGNSASSAYQAAADKMSQTMSSIADTATTMEKKSIAAAMDTMAMVKDQPLVLLGLGLALGAAVGACLPMTEAENQLLGEAADEVKEEAKEMASQTLETAKDIVSDSFETAKDTVLDATDEVLDTAKDAVQKITERGVKGNGDLTKGNPYTRYN